MIFPCGWACEGGGQKPAGTSWTCALATSLWADWMSIARKAWRLLTSWWPEPMREREHSIPDWLYPWVWDRYIRGLTIPSIKELAFAFYLAPGVCTIDFKLSHPLPQEATHLDLSLAMDTCVICFNTSPLLALKSWGDTVSVSPY